MARKDDLDSNMVSLLPVIAVKKQFGGGMKWDLPFKNVLDFSQWIQGCSFAELVSLKPSPNEITQSLKRCGIKANWSDKTYSKCSICSIWREKPDLYQQHLKTFRAEDHARRLMVLSDKRFEKSAVVWGDGAGENIFFPKNTRCVIFFWFEFIVLCCRYVPLQRIQKSDLWKCYTIVDKTHRRIYYYLYPAWKFNSELLSITQTFLFHFCCCAIGDGIENLLVESDSGPTVFFLYLSFFIFIFYLSFSSLEWIIPSWVSSFVSVTYYALWVSTYVRVDITKA